MTTQSPHWRSEPMMLLVVGIPLTSVIVSFTFLAIAITSFDGVVEDDYYRQGKEINRLLLRDDTAARLQLSANVAIGENRVVAQLSAAQPLEWPENLTLRLLHPTRDGFDLTLLLQRQSAGTDSAQHYGAVIPSIATGEWILQIDTPTWRLMRRGRYGNQHTVRLGSNSE